MKNIIVNRQLITTDIEALKEYAMAQPKSKGRALNLFVDWQSKMATINALQNKSRKIYKDYHSYGLKHQIERLSKYLTRWDQWEHNDNPICPWHYGEYCGNEEFIVAMLQAGFDCRNSANLNIRPPGPNYYFNIEPLKERGSRNIKKQTGVGWIDKLCHDMNITLEDRDAHIRF